MKRPGHIRTSLVALLTCATTLLGGCSIIPRGPDIEVSSDLGDTARLERAQTFHWSLSAPTGANVFQEQDEFLGLIQATVGNELVRRGYRPVDDGGDLEISALVIYRAPGTQAAADEYFGTNRIPEALVSASQRGQILSYDAGSLILDIEDARTHESIWRASITPAIDRAKPFEKQQKKLTRSIIRTIKEIPPSGGD